MTSRGGSSRGKHRAERLSLYFSERLLEQGGAIVGAGKIVLLVFGIIVLVVSAGLVFSGGALLWADSVLKDDEGFYTTRTVRLDKDSYAIVTEPAEINLSAGGVWDWSNLVTFKVEGANDDPSKQIFMGVAEESDLNSYLNDVEYDKIVVFKIYPYEIDYINHPGSAEPETPTSQTFWSESVYGPGLQTLEWELEPGTWSIVLMNEDGSAGLDLSVAVGAKAPFIFGTGVGLLAGGIVGLIVGFVMVYFAVRKS